MDEMEFSGLIVDGQHAASGVIFVQRTCDVRQSLVLLHVGLLRVRLVRQYEYLTRMVRTLNVTIQQTRFAAQTGLVRVRHKGPRVLHGDPWPKFPAITDRSRPERRRSLSITMLFPSTDDTAPTGPLHLHQRSSEIVVENVIFFFKSRKRLSDRRPTSIDKSMGPERTCEMWYTISLLCSCKLYVRLTAFRSSEEKIRLVMYW